VARVASDGNRFAQQLFQPLPARYDRLAEVLSFGQNRRWRRAMVDPIVSSSPARILDVASGTAGVALQLARRTGADVAAVDLTEGMLREGRRKVMASGMDGRIHLMLGRGEQLPFPDAVFDALTFTYLLRYVDDPAATMRELARVMKPGANIGMVEFGVPSSPALRNLWRIQTRVGLPVIGRLVSPAWYEVGRFLGPNIEEFHAREPDLGALWQPAGIEQVQIRHMSFGAGLVMHGVRSPDGQRAA
jgi:demethylmenaquinone methyltransferase / 2-methoxy-6-polyprenyl-1,4-benzoquinol methylase